jgi:hypothetical protein
MRLTHTAALVAALVTLGACGGYGGNTTPTPTATPTTQIFSGTTRQTATGCTGDSHDVTAAAGEIAVRLVATSDPAGALSVQVCAGGIDNGNCSIRQQRIAVNERITGTRIGAASQNLKLLGHNCVFGGPAVTDPITYQVEMTYQRQ